MCSEDISTKDQLINQLINAEGVCRTAPATPGLLKKDWSLCLDCVCIYFYTFFSSSMGGTKSS